MTKVYVICNLCDDSYYEGHISRERVAFATKEAAEAKLAKLNNLDDDDPYFYITEVEVKA